MAEPIPEKPNKNPNFLIVVILFALTILVVLILAVFVFKKDGKKLIPHGPNPAPNSRLLVPAPVLAAATIHIA